MPYLLSNEVVAVVTWLGTIVTVVGLPMTALGVFWTYQQAGLARKASVNAQTASQAAERAAAEALEGSRLKWNLLNVAGANADIETFKILIDQRNLVAASVLFASFRSRLTDTCDYLSQNGLYQEEVAVVQKNLRRIEHQINAGRSGVATFKPTVIFHALSGISRFLAERETEFRHRDPGNA